MFTDKFKNRVFYSLILYSLLHIVLVIINNSYVPVIKIRFLNEAVKPFNFFWLLNFIIFVLFLPRKLFKWEWKELNISYINILFALLVIVLWIFSFYFSNSILITTLAHRVTIDYFIACILLLFTSTFVEEFIYREILLKKISNLLNSKYSILFSIIISSLVFCISHISRAYYEYESFSSGLKFLLYILLAGIAYCIIYHYTKNFVLIVVLHMFMNFEHEFLFPLDFKSFHFHEASILLIYSLTFLVLFNYSIKRIGPWTKKVVNIIYIISFFTILYINIKNDDVIEYYNNGAKKATLEDSFLTFYDIKGRTIAFGKYLDGKKVGNWFEYDTTGTIKWQGEYPDELK